MKLTPLDIWLPSHLLMSLPGDAYNVQDNAQFTNYPIVQSNDSTNANIETICKYKNNIIT